MRSQAPNTGAERVDFEQRILAWYDETSVKKDQKKADTVTAPGR